MVTFIRERVARLRKELLIESPYFVLPAQAQATVKALHERKVRVRVLTNSLASNDMLAAHSGYAKTRRPLLENGMELYELRPDTDEFRSGWSPLSGRSPAALHTKAMAFDREAVLIGSFNLDPRSAVINTEASLYIESPGACGTADGLHGDRRRARQQLPRPHRPEWRDHLGDRDRRPHGALPGRARNRLPASLRRQPVEAPADRLAAMRREP